MTEPEITVDNVELIEDAGYNEVWDVLSVDGESGLGVFSWQLYRVPDVVVQSEAAWRLQHRLAGAQIHAYPQPAIAQFRQTVVGLAGGQKQDGLPLMRAKMDGELGGAGCVL